ncbi:MAG: hypothetical protein ACK5LR_07005, partial [Mangrovibacterium sp.]
MTNLLQGVEKSYESGKYLLESSKVVDKNGEPMVVYHGTNADFNVFDSDKTMDSVFWFSSDKGKIERGESGSASSGKIKPLFINLRNPAEWNEHENLTTDQIINNGYDGIILDDDFVAFSPNQIKSATDNVGTFDEGSNDIRFRVEENLEQVNDEFNSELKRKDALPKGHIFKLGMPSETLINSGFPNLPIELSLTQLDKKTSDTGHSFDSSEIKDLPKAIANPIAVFSYGNPDKSQNLITSIKQGDKRFLVGVHFNQNKNGITVNSIRGLFPKDTAEWLNWISQDKAIYLNKEKIQNLIDQQRTNLADVKYLDLDLTSKIIEDFDNGKNSDIKFRSEELSKPYNGKVPMSDIDKAAADLRAEFGDNQIYTVQDSSELPPHIARQVKKAGGKVQGIFDAATGQVFIVGENINNKEEVRAIVLHELLAHKGLRNVFGENEKLDRFLQGVYDSMTEVDKENLRQLYGDDQLLIAEEYIASMAERYKKPNLIKRTIARVRSLVREVFGVSYSHNDIMSILARSERGFQMQAKPSKESYSSSEDYLNAVVEHNTGEPLNEVRYRAVEVNRVFNENLDMLIKGDLEDGFVFDMGMPSDALLMGGLPNLPIELSAERLERKSKQDNHEFKLSNLKNL